MSTAAPAVSVLVLGGLGFIGRHFVKYLVDFDLATHIRVVDRVLPVMAYLNPTFATVMSNPRVEFLQANLAHGPNIDRAFAPSEHCPHRFNLVVALAAETKYGQPEAVYEAYVRDLRIACARKAAAENVDWYVEVSTAQVYSGSSSKPAKETDAPKPWTVLAKFHLEAELAIRSIPGLRYSVLRLPIVYGPGDRTGLMPRLVCAAVYRHTGAKMEFLWGEDLRIHTVHVQDVAAALWHLLCGGASGEVFNLADAGDTTQGAFNKIIEAIFGIETGFYGTLTSTLAQFKLEEMVEEANGELMSGWTDLCRTTGTSMSPLTPYIDKELLMHAHLAVDASKLQRTGFSCSCPQLTRGLVEDSLRYWTGLSQLPGVPPLQAA